MVMSKGDAAYVNVILGWMTGNPEISTATAYQAGRELAERARRVMPGGVQPIALVQCEGLADRPHATHRMLAELLADCWAVEHGDASWPGAEVVDIVQRALTAHGYDTAHPARSDDREEFGPFSRELLRGIALTRPRTATANTVTHAESPSAEGVSPE